MATRNLRPSKENPIPLYSGGGSPLLTGAATAAGPSSEGRSLWRDAWGRLLRNRLAFLGLVVLAVMLTLTFIGPPVLEKLTGLNYAAPPANPLFQKAIPPLRNGDGAFSLQHLMGTDNAGRDLLSRVLIGGRVSLLVGLIATLVSLLIGVSYGAIAGYVGGGVDNAMMRVVDILYALPYMLIVIVLLALFGKSDLFGSSATGRLMLLFIALGAVSWLNMARIVRGQILSLKNQDFVLAARATGVSPTRIIFRHLVPNALGPVIVYATLTVPAVMLQEAFLSYLGLGVQAPLASWGSLAAEGVKSIAIYPWQLLFPGLTMALTLFSLNFLGDGLRDALDPQTRKS